MFRNFRNGRWLIATAVVVASCSQGDNGQITSPSATAAANPAGGTAVGLAEGDVRIGPGPVAIEAVRMDRQTPTGASILRQYASPGQEYRLGVGETIELWVEWVRGGNNAPLNPRFSVDWGEGELDRFDFTPCGGCLLKHNYPRAGRYTVKVTLDDRAGTTVSRTFFLNSLEPAPGPSPSPSPSPSCVAPTLAPSFPEDVCDGDGTFDTSPFFVGAGLTYSLANCPTPALRGSPIISINPSTGVITASFGTYCVRVTATNGCGSAFWDLTYRAFCSI